MILPRRTPRMRPDFRVELEAKAPAFLAQIERQLAEEECPFVGQVLGSHAVIRIPPDQSSLMSPLLDLELITRDGGLSTLRGRFTPEPNVWTGFMAVFATIGLLGLAAMMYGFAQMTVDQTPWSLLGGPIAVALIAFVYGAVFIGQGLSSNEMYSLHAFVDRALREIEVEPPARL